MRDFHRPGRSTVRCQGAALATSHPLATSAGLDVLRRGGNAVDAAVCAASVLAVVEPEQSGLGGDCFAIVAAPGRDVVALDGAGWAPAAASRQWYAERGFRSMPFDGPHSVTVPGAVDAWCRLLEDYGTWGIGDALAAAIGYAAEGHPVHERVGHDWTSCVAKLSQDPHAAAVFLPGGRAPETGEMFRQPLLAETLRAVASGGRDAFYAGPVARDIVARLRELGGLHDLDDFADYRSRYVRPLAAPYAGMDILQCPPSGQGFTTLAMLRLLDALGCRGGDPLSPRRLHLFAEAAKLAYGARDRLVGDDPRSRAMAEAWLSPDNVARLAHGIDPDAASPAPYPARAMANTVYVCAVDDRRTVVSLISSVYQSFGSGIVAPRSGVALQNRGAGFSLVDGHPNVIAGRKRPLHTIIPGLMMRDGKPVTAFGMVGGDFQPFGQSWLVSNMVDFGLDPQRAIDLPRAFAFDGAYRLERTVPESVAVELARMGHLPQRWPLPLGSAQIVSIDWQKGLIAAGSDGRTDGCALGY